MIAMVKVVAFLDGSSVNNEITVDFDDSIIEDSNATIDKNIKLVQAGLRSKVTAIMEINKCSEADAKKELEKIAEDNQITAQDIDWTDGEEQEDEEGQGTKRKIGFRMEEEDDDTGESDES